MLNANPILKSHARIGWRSVGKIATIFAAAICFSMVVIPLLSDFASEGSITQSPTAGMKYYWILIVIQALIGLFGIIKPVIDAIDSDRKSGTLDSNFLSPLTPQSIAFGYLLGPAMLGIGIYLLFSLVGLIVNLIFPQPITLWLKSQALMSSTTLLFACFGMTAGLLGASSRNTFVVFLLGIPILLFFSIEPKLCHFFSVLIPTLPFMIASPKWMEIFKMGVSLFGIRVHPVMLSLMTQGAFFTLAWMASIRKIRYPHGSAVTPGLGFAAFGLAALLQYGLSFQYLFNANAGERTIYRPMVPFYTLVILSLFALFLTMTMSRSRQWALHQILSKKKNSFGSFLKDSAVSYGLGMAVVTGILSSYIMHGVLQKGEPTVYFIVTASAVSLVLFIGIVAELGTLIFHNYRSAFYILCFFLAFFAMPLAVMPFAKDEFFLYSFFAPAIYTMSEKNHTAEALLPATVHLVVVILFGVFWIGKMRQLFIKTAEMIPEGD